MENITRTVYGSALQSAMFAGLPFSMDNNTTLNEKFGVLAGQPPEAGKMPTAQYYCIGNGGHQLATGTGGVALVETVQHTATDAALYKHLPFALRLATNDLGPAQQAQYALRTPVIISGQSYFAYYLKRLNISGSAVNSTLQTVVNGITTSSNFIPTTSNLSPTPPVLNSAGANILASQYVNCSTTLPINLSQSECSEIMDAATLLYGDPAYAIISEIGICTGVDKLITLTNGQAFNEAVAVQISSFISTMHVVQYTATGISGSFDFGSSDPLLVLAPL